MKIIDLRKKNVIDLNIELIDLLREQFNLRIQAGSKKLKQFHLLKKVRRNIAKVKTLITEKRKA